MTVISSKVGIRFNQINSKTNYTSFTIIKKKKKRLTTSPIPC